MISLLKKCSECGNRPATNKVYWESDDSTEHYCKECYESYLDLNVDWTTND